MPTHWITQSSISSSLTARRTSESRRDWLNSSRKQAADKAIKLSISMLQTKTVILHCIWSVGNLPAKAVHNCLKEPTLIWCKLPSIWFLSVAQTQGRRTASAIRHLTSLKRTKTTIWLKFWTVLRISHNTKRSPALIFKRTNSPAIANSIRLHLHRKPKRLHQFVSPDHQSLPTPTCTLAWAALAAASLVRLQVVGKDSSERKSASAPQASREVEL